MRILILVQATKIEPWHSIIEAQKATWDSIHEGGVDTLYYYSGEEQCINDKDLYLKCPHEADMNNYRFKLALDYLYDSNDPRYDYIFRTNASSYVDKKRLKEWLMDKPRTNFYCGIDGGGFASGCGFALSTDLVNILRTIDDYPTTSEDCLIGVYLERAGIKVTPGAQRHDYYFTGGEIPLTYHYRCKSDTEDRTKDIKAFNHLYAILNK
jgi:hypothetical protein